MAKPDDYLNLIAQYLDDNNVDNVFAGKQPTDPANCTSLLGLPGNTLTANRDVSALQFPRFQAIVRNEDYATGSLQHQLVRQLLHGKINLVLPTTADVEEDPYIRIMRMFCEQEGGPIGQDKLGRYEFSINFALEFHNVETA